MRRLPALAVLVLAAVLPSCGHRGDPLPPKRKTPPPPQGFRLAQRGDTLEMRAVAPTASVDGVAYQTLEIEFLYADGQKNIEKAGQKQAVPAAPGARVSVTLPLPAPGTQVRGAARGLAGREGGPRTLTMSLTTQAPLEAPHDLTAVLTDEGVSLTWRGPQPKAARPPAPDVKAAGAAAPPGAQRQSGSPPAPNVPGRPEVPRASLPEALVPGAPPKEPAPGGFLVYRRVGKAAFDEPLVGEPLERRSLEDAAAPTGATACYVVRAALSTDPLVESAPSNEACVEVRDVTAPPVPSGLAVLPREGGLEVLWGPSTAADLAGYRVFRATEGGPPARIAEVPADRVSWLDATAAHGVVYRYSVTAFDQAGNESGPAEAVEASLP